MDKYGLNPEMWWNPYWFRPDVLTSFAWENPYFLYAIPSIPLFYILKWALHFRFRQRIEIAFFNLKLPRDWSALARFIPPGVQSLFLALLLVALARPQRTSELAEQKSEGIDIVIATDISQSMELEDIKPNRLEGAKKVAANFIMGRNVDRIGLVVFAGDAFSMAPLTNDYALLQDYIDEIDFSLITKSGTAIGSALAVATNRMLESKAKSRVIILLSDGDNTAGNIEPNTAARIAIGYGIKIYTIGVGKDGPVPFQKDIFGNTQYVENTMDERALREIAKIGQGQFFRATSEQTLQSIFQRIDALEKSEVRIRRYRQTEDYYWVYLNWAMVMLLLWLASKSTFMTNALED
jgi:Ca-activated chloride channel family protein